MKIKQLIFKQLSPEQRQKIIRRSFDLDKKNNHYVFKIAETRDELEGAFRLLYKCYLSSGLMTPNPSELRCTIYQALPYSTILIAKEGPQVIGTVCIIKDSQIGLPSDKSFLEINNDYRKKGFQLCEISALAVDEKHRHQHNVSLPLMKFLHHYSQQYLGCTLMCAVTHPRAYDFYAGLFNFKHNGKVVEYNLANGALGAHISLEINAVKNYTELLFKNYPKKWNLYQYLFEEITPEIKFPLRRTSYKLDPVMKPEYLKYFFVEKTDLFESLSPKEQSLIRSAWEPYFSIQEVPYLNSAKQDRLFRLPVAEKAVLLKNNKAVFCQIFDLSIGGAFIFFEGSLILESQYQIIFNFGSKTFTVPTKVQWHDSQGTTHKPKGYGIKFLEIPQGLSEEIRAHCGIHSEAKEIQTPIIPIKKAS